MFVFIEQQWSRIQSEKTQAQYICFRHSWSFRSWCGWKQDESFTLSHCCGHCFSFFNSESFEHLVWKHHKWKCVCCCVFHWLRQAHQIIHLESHQQRPQCRESGQRWWVCFSQLLLFITPKQIYIFLQTSDFSVTNLVPLRKFLFCGHCVQLPEKFTWGVRYKTVCFFASNCDTSGPNNLKRFRERNVIQRTFQFE